MTKLNYGPHATTVITKRLNGNGKTMTTRKNKPHINTVIKSVIKNKNKIKEAVNHPSHYGGQENPYEAIKVIEAWNLNFKLGNTVKYISRAGKKDNTLQDLKKAKWYLDREIQKLEETLVKS